MRRKGFTLIEMTIVIAIIVLAMTLAIPAIRSLTGSRSQEAAQNVLTTALGSARSRAMAMQKVTGILFYIDGGSDRVSCAMVEETPAAITDPTDVSIAYLDLVPDVDPIQLPPGLRLFTMRDTLVHTPSVDPFSKFTEYFTGRYMGYNSPGAPTPPNPQDPKVQNPPGGVILFDAAGRLVTRTYGFRLTAATSPATLTQLGQLIYGANGAVVPDWPRGTAPYPWLNSSIGLVLVDRETFLNRTAQAGQYTDWNVQANQTEVDNYLNTYATPIFINRYDASLMRAE